MWKKASSIAFLHQICSTSALQQQKLEQKSNCNLFQLALLPEQHSTASYRRFLGGSNLREGLQRIFSSFWMPQWGWRRRTGGGKNYGLHSASIIHYILSIRCRGELRSNVRQTFGMCQPACVPFLETFFARSTAIDDLECISDIGFIPLLQCMTQTKHALHRF